MCSIEQWFSVLGDFAFWDVWLCLETFLTVTAFGRGWGGVQVATGFWWVEARNATKHPLMHRTAPMAALFPLKCKQCGERETLV